MDPSATAASHFFKHEKTDLAEDLARMATVQSDYTRNPLSVIGRLTFVIGNDPWHTKNNGHRAMYGFFSI